MSVTSTPRRRPTIDARTPKTPSVMLPTIRDMLRVHVIEIGTRWVRYGLCDEMLPRNWFPATLKCPMTGKTVKLINRNYSDEIQKFYLYAYFKSRLGGFFTSFTCDCRCMFIDDLVSDSRIMHFFAQYYYETVKNPLHSYFPSPVAISLLFSAPTGLYVNIGYSSTTIIPVYEGYVAFPETQFTAIGSKTLHTVFRDYMISCGKIRMPDGRIRKINNHDIEEMDEHNLFEEFVNEYCIATNMARGQVIQACRVPDLGKNTQRAHTRYLRRKKNVEYTYARQLYEDENDVMIFHRRYGELLMSGDRFLRIKRAPKQPKVDERKNIKLPFKLGKKIEIPFGHKKIIIDGFVREWAAEIFFRHDYATGESSIPELISNAISDAPIDYRKALLENIMLVGGVAAMRGIKGRLKAELADVIRSKFGDKFGNLPEHIAFRRALTNKPFETYASWLGGSLTAHPYKTVFRRYYVAYAREPLVREDRDHSLVPPDWKYK